MKSSDQADSVNVSSFLSEEHDAPVFFEKFAKTKKVDVDFVESLFSTFRPSLDVIYLDNRGRRNRKSCSSHRAEQ